MEEPVSVIGAGLAGCEAAWQLAERGISVNLYEMKPQKYTPAHQYPGFAELVCSNSLKAARLESAAGLLKHEMEHFGSLTVDCAKKCSVAAGGALAVDRYRFSDLVTQRLRDHKKVCILEQEITQLPEGFVIVATGPLTSDGLAQEIQRLCGEKSLSFFDAASPIISRESLDLEQVFFAARYDRGEDDYLNCPMNREQYEAFYEALIHGESAPLHDFDCPIQVYEGCMPIEILAKRGKDTLRFGPLKPVGLRDPKTGHRPWAVVQLRQENAEGTLYNLVGFQTNLKFGEQKRIFSMIPGLEKAEFARYGVMHRNTFLNSPKVLDGFSRLQKEPRIFFAGQMTGVEGYMESAASGILAGRNLARMLEGKEPLLLPRDTMMGALIGHLTNTEAKDFQPMGANMGILPPLEKRERDKGKRYLQLAQKAVDSLKKALREAGEGENMPKMAEPMEKETEKNRKLVL